jgi:hypothetical protein
VVPEAGYLPWLDEPALVAGLVREFLCDDRTLGKPTSVWCDPGAMSVQITSVAAGARPTHIELRINVRRPSLAIASKSLPSVNGDPPARTIRHQ